MTAPLGRERTSGVIEEAIIDLALRNYTPTQIAKEMPSVAKQFSVKPPSLRTIQRIHARNRPRTGVAWRIIDSTEDDALLVLDFLAEAVQETQGRVTQVTREEAQWIARLRSRCPGLDFMSTVRLLRLYGQRMDADQATVDLDGFLAFSPWRDEEHARAYLLVIEKGQIGAPPAFLQDFVGAEWLDHQILNALDTPIGPDARAMLAKFLKNPPLQLGKEG